MILTKGLIRNANLTPFKTAILEDEHCYTYGQLAERTAKLKNALKGMGVKKGDRVGLLMQNSFRYIEIFYATTAMGAIVVPLNYRLALEELEYVINDSGLKALFLHQEFLTLIPHLQEKTPSVKNFILAENEGIESNIISYEHLIAKENAKAQDLEYDEVNEEDVAGIFYTGGTTGRAKGVMLTHRNMISNYYQSSVTSFLDSNTNYLHIAPMFHLADGASTVNVTMVGGTHSIAKAFTPRAFLEAVGKYKVTSVTLVPTMINMVLQEPEFDKYDLGSLKRMTYGASPMPLALLKKAIGVFPQVQFLQAFGMTEASPALTILSFEDHLLFATENNQEKLRSCGRAIIGVELKIIDENGNPVVAGQIGEVIAKGPNIMKGYWNMPEETASVIKNGWYHTGDMARIDDEQYIYIVDRKKDMIITGGENVYSPEVENVLFKHADVVEAVVIGVPDDKWGEAVTAIVVKKMGSTITEKEIIDFTRTSLANYKVPKSVVFTDELPKSAAGKILKRNLRDQYWKEISQKVN
ncbi:long-chain-fatty-acid--CoA ligase [Peribacillus frigoritolerans]|uniref:long-chain-fatty-acid--CoA ligase n=1 Tax=Peribacillus frigoritolerans TaxID=450367 RepID=UPI0021D0DB50|nr:long-chain-fatty-acid--CoA ligase [Peribacillus frigoritolerans]MCU6598962.1 long-chain-fatty-acid--CoA ligase [Peribacillus frigoritolerans]